MFLVIPVNRIFLRIVFKSSSCCLHKTYLRVQGMGCFVAATKFTNFFLLNMVIIKCSEKQNEFPTLSTTMCTFRNDKYRLLYPDYRNSTLDSTVVSISMCQTFYIRRAAPIMWRRLALANRTLKLIYLDFVC